MIEPNRVEVTFEDLVKALGQKEVQIIGLNKLIHQLQTRLAEVGAKVEEKLKELQPDG